MKRLRNALRGKLIYLIGIAVGIVLIVAWYFLLMSPKRDEAAALDTQILSAQTNLTSEQQKLARYKSYQKSAPQSRTEIVRLGKMLPESEAVPSLIVDLSKTAKAANVSFDTITRASTTSGKPFGIQTVTVQVTGKFFDVEDFLHRLESYVAWRNASYRVTGRLLQVTNMNISIDSGDTKAANVPLPLKVTLTIDGYLWGGAAKTGASGGAAGGSGQTTTTSGDGS